MARISLIVALVLFLASGCTKKNPPTTEETKYTEKDLYFYSYTSINGEQKKLVDLKGKKILFVNTASLCSNTPQYEKLEELYQKYKSKLVVIGFPCNQFGSQEPGSDDDIEEFCTKNYQVTFPMASKIDVKGPNVHPIYKWLCTKDLNGKETTEVAWNFQKYLVDENGSYLKMFPDTMDPMHADITSAVEK